MPERYDVVIVGAGVCGLTAAVELSPRRDLKILVLEADHEPGGRVKSMTLANGLIVDTGAHWFHGGDKSPFYRWANSRYDLGETVLDKADKITAFWRQGDIGALDAAIDRVRQAYENAGRPDISLHDAATIAGDPLAQEAVLYVTREWMATEDPKQARAAELFDDPLGYDGWQIVGGIGSVTRAMADEAARNGVRFEYGAIVSHVGNKPDGVEIICADGRSFHAGRVLVTVSAGVLKQESIMFDPETARAIQDKMRALHMGNLAKIVVPLREAFFEERGIETNGAFDLVDDHCYMQARSAGKPAVTIFIGGDSSDIVEAMDDAALEEFADTILGKIPQFEGYKNFRNGALFKTYWRGNALAKGSYAIGLPGHARSDPFATGAVVFAGEAFLASAKDSPGQMAGAFNSAMKAVKQFLLLT